MSGTMARWATAAFEAIISAGILLGVIEAFHALWGSPMQFGPGAVVGYWGMAVFATKRPWRRTDG